MNFVLKLLSKCGIRCTQISRALAYSVRISSKLARPLPQRFEFMRFLDPILLTVLGTCTPTAGNLLFALFVSRLVSTGLDRSFFLVFPLRFKIFSSVDSVKCFPAPMISYERSGQWK